MNEEMAAWFATWWPLWAPFLLLIVGGAVSGIWVIINRRGGEFAARKNPLPPTWPEMWARIDAQDARIDVLEEANRDLTNKHDALVIETRRKDGQIDELINHILVLEPLIPNPPGPPARPSWITLTI